MKVLHRDACGGSNKSLDIRVVSGGSILDPDSEVTIFIVYILHIHLINLQVHPIHEIEFSIDLESGT